MTASPKRRGPGYRGSTGQLISQAEHAAIHMNSKFNSPSAFDVTRSDTRAPRG